MARPRKIDDYLVHRIADLFHYGDSLRFSQLKQGDVWTIMLADERVRISGERDIQLAIGESLCHLKAEVRPRILHQIADALAGKSAKKRKSGKADDIAKIREAHRRAKAKQKGLYRGDNPTFREVEHEYLEIYGWKPEPDQPARHLNRRALRDAGCPVRPEPKWKKSSRRMK